MSLKRHCDWCSEEIPDGDEPSGAAIAVKVGIDWLDPDEEELYDYHVRCAIEHGSEIFAMLIRDGIEDQYGVDLPDPNQDDATPTDGLDKKAMN